MNKRNYLKNQYMEMWLEDGYFYGKYLQGVIIDYKCAVKIMEDREEVCEYKAYPFLCDCREVNYWTKEARDFQNTPRNYKYMTAGAILYTESNVSNIIINFFMKFNKPLIPAKFFTNYEDAIKWLEPYKVKYL